VLRDGAPPASIRRRARWCSAGGILLANSRADVSQRISSHLITLLVAIVAPSVFGRRAWPRSGGRSPSAPVAVATFSFGPGLALFVALAVVLAIVRASWRHVALVIVAMLATLAVYFALPGGQGVSGVLKLQPAANLRIAAQWLASPIMYLLLPLVDGNLAGVLPGELLRRVATWTAGRYEAQFGNVWQSVAAGGDRRRGDRGAAAAQPRALAPPRRHAHGVRRVLFAPVRAGRRRRRRAEPAAYFEVYWDRSTPTATCRGPACSGRALVLCGAGARARRSPAAGSIRDERCWRRSPSSRSARLPAIRTGWAGRATRRSPVIRRRC
jgi:hypothetical protein